MIKMIRIFALILLLIPGFLAAVGIKFMRDTLFGILHSPIPFLWLQFLAGFILFVAGLGFVAGFILHRDRKRKKVQTRFQQDKNRL
jgi:polyferredoxin